MPKRRDEQAYQIGRPFGNLTILAEGAPKVRILRTWLCRCVCGGTKTVPENDYWLDRFPDNNGNYEPGNVRWSTIKAQCRNRRSNHRISVDDTDLTIVEWAERLNVDRHTITRAILRGERPKDVITRLSRRAHAEASK